MKPHKTSPAAAVVFVAALLAGCDGGAGGDPTAAPATGAPSTTATAAPATTPTQAPTPDPTTTTEDSSVSVSGGDPTSSAGGETEPELGSDVSTTSNEVTSDVEVRVAEIISDFDGEVTTEGTMLTLPGEVLFDTDKSELRPQARAELDEIVEVLEFYENAPVRIVGHTDSRGSDEYNDDLSQRRAASVDAYLVSKGIDQSRLETTGRGEREPVATNDTARGRQQNRRVTVTVVGVTPPDTGN